MDVRTILRTILTREGRRQESSLLPSPRMEPISTTPWLFSPHLTDQLIWGKYLVCSSQPPPWEGGLFPYCPFKDALPPPT